MTHRPRHLSEHAIERYRERVDPSTTRAEAEIALRQAIEIGRPWMVHFDPKDLDGDGQAIWRTGSLLLTVDSGCVVRTVTRAPTRL